MAITCGNCKGKHDTSAEVRDCFGVPVQAKAFEQAKAQVVATADAATEKQVAFIAKLAAERGVEQPTEGLTKKGASVVIEALLAKPKVAAPASAPQVEIEDGIYLHDGTIYKVIHAVHGSGKQYAKALDLSDNGDGTFTGTWNYAGRKPLTFLTEEHRLTAAKAKEFGLLYGMCVNCARDLTKEESIHVGYGQTCAKNNGWHYPTKAELKALSAQAVSA